ncbi:unnamed protein product [Trichobilharzia regenti]|nr:unnamed protein product [Trichobilharzia regenti]
MNYSLCYKIGVNRHYPSLSPSSELSTSSKLTIPSRLAPQMLTDDEYATLYRHAGDIDEGNEDQSRDGREDYPVYNYYQHYPKVYKRVDLSDLSIHSDMAFLKKLLDRKNDNLLKLG